jgi:hypothetical protein
MVKWYAEEKLINKGRSSIWKGIINKDVYRIELRKAR